MLHKNSGKIPPNGILRRKRIVGNKFLTMGELVHKVSRSSVSGLRERKVLPAKYRP
jgi:hypothetical protein